MPVTATKHPDSFSLSFSGRAAQYATSRPRYPQELYARLADLAPNRELAWDVGTGSGQAAMGLVEHFGRVVATDASPEQLRHATAHPRISYREASAERSGLADGSVSLITSACAVHWFNLENFYSEARRVGVPGAIIALWTYFYPLVGNKADTPISRYYLELVGPLLPRGQDYYMRYYADLPFPFQELAPPIGQMTVSWTLPQLLSFMGTYSTRPRYRELHGRDPLELVSAEISAEWGDPQLTRELTMPLGFKIGRIK